jgi:pilus assembly protein Flp/PilA
VGEVTMTNLILRFVKDKSGATAIEYGLIAVLIGVAIIAGATALGGGLNSLFQGLADDNFGAGG